MCETNSLISQELSSVNRERVKKNAYPYRGGRKGYANIEQSLRDSQGAASDVTIGRPLLWAAARQNKEGRYDNPCVQEDVSRMVSIFNS